MKKLLSILLALSLLAGALGGCGGSDVQKSTAPESTGAAPETMGSEPEVTESAPEVTESAPKVYDDGRARPSSCGRLRVKDGNLCSEDGKPVMLRGVSTNGLIASESFINETLFEELSRDAGINLFRLAMYTYGVGIIGYCTNGSRERYHEDLAKGIEYAKKQDMYVIVDWHILKDGDPNTYVDKAKVFFAEMAETYRDYDNVLYEICNEPNGVDWAAVKRYAEAVIPVIREKDPKAVIIVGNPDWSKDLRSVAADPLDFDNILYTLHFYSASHGQEYRDMTEKLSREGLPIFVTEYGVTAASGDHPRDLESADKWIELLEQENISYCMWSFSKVAEASAAVRSTVPKYSGFVREDYTETGLWLLDTLAKHKTR